jgi:microsomal prostaglandin-E synthase 2
MVGQCGCMYMFAQVVEVNPLSKKEIKWSEFKKVLILTVDGENLVDLSA